MTYVEKQFFDCELVTSLIQLELEMGIRKDQPDDVRTKSLEKDIRSGILEDRTIGAIETEIKNRRKDWEEENKNQFNDYAEKNEE